MVIFQLLFMGRHPFSGRYLGAGEMPLERAISEFRFAYGVDAEARKMRQPPGTLALDSMPSQFVGLFRRAFLSTDRPRPREWIEPLDALAKALKKCESHNGHYYYRELRDLPVVRDRISGPRPALQLPAPRGRIAARTFPARRNLEGYCERRAPRVPPLIQWIND